MPLTAPTSSLSQDLKARINTMKKKQKEALADLKMRHEQEVFVLQRQLADAKKVVPRMRRAAQSGASRRGATRGRGRGSSRIRKKAT